MPVSANIFALIGIVQKLNFGTIPNTQQYFLVLVLAVAIAAKPISVCLRTANNARRCNKPIIFAFTLTRLIGIMPLAAIFAFFNLSVFFQFITIMAKRIAPARFSAKLTIHIKTPQKKRYAKERTSPKRTPFCFVATQMTVSCRCKRRDTVLTNVPRQENNSFV